jgi:hypothetical protein
MEEAIASRNPTHQIDLSAATIAYQDRVLRKIRSALVTAALAPVRLYRRLWRRRRPRPGSRRVLVAFTRGHLEPTVLDAAIRFARAEEATLVPAYLIVIPMQFALDAPMSQEVSMAIPLVEAVEHAASRAGIPVDARLESGRTPIHALERLWNVEHFDRIVIPAPAGREPGFTPKELLWMLTNAPSATLILRPDPALRAAEVRAVGERTRLAPSRRRVAIPSRTPTDGPIPRVAATKAG